MSNLLHCYKNYSLALILSIAFFITLFTMQKHQINDKIVGIIIVDGINNGTKEAVVNTTSTVEKVSNEAEMPPEKAIKKVANQK